MRTNVLKNSTTYYNNYMVLAAAIVSLLMAVLLGTTGCATVTVPPVTSYEAAKAEVDKRGPLVTKPIEERENYKPGSSQVVKKDAPAPYKGILIDEDKAAYYVAIKAERDRRREELEAARKKAAIQQIIADSTIEHLSAKALARGTWWEQNKGLVGFGIGIVVGMAIVTGLVYGLTRGDGVGTSSTNTHILVPVR